MLWLLASEHSDPTSGLVEQTNKAISFRLRVTEKEVSGAIDEAISAGFIELLQSCNETVTKPYTNRNETVTPETESYTETEKRQSTKNGISAFRQSDLSEMNDWFSTNAPSVNKDKLRTKILDWCSAKGKTYKDYFAAMRTWATKEHAENVSKGWSAPKTPVNYRDPYAHLTGGSNA